MSTDIMTLSDLGWSAHFQSQVAFEEFATLRPARVAAVHRNGLDLLTEKGPTRGLPLAGEGEGAAAIGDWLLVEPETLRPRRLLARKSLFKRRAAGPKVAPQLIAANIDTLFIVSSCNQDFNIARLERYLALAREAEVMPVIVLTKSDLAVAPDDYVRAAARLMPGLMALALNALEKTAVDELSPWLRRGETIAVLGSSGVGKSTLVNTLMGGHIQSTQGIREDDAKGRHTTTGRSLHRLPSGAWLIDTPGMRELQLTDVSAGIESVFADVAEIAAVCRFSDCRHETEPGCAIREAIENGLLTPERLKRYEKLRREDRRNSEELWERNQRNRAFGRMVKSHVARKKKSRAFED